VFSSVFFSACNPFLFQVDGGELLPSKDVHILRRVSRLPLPGTCESLPFNSGSSSLGKQCFIIFCHLLQKVSQAFFFGAVTSSSLSLFSPNAKISFPLSKTQQVHHGVLLPDERLTQFLSSFPEFFKAPAPAPPPKHS